MSLDTEKGWEITFGLRKFRNLREEDNLGAI